MDDEKKIRVKVVIPSCEGAVFSYENALFIHNQSVEDYDWFVAYDELPRRQNVTVTCPRERTMLLTSEPTSIKRYSSAYVKQFGHLLTNRPPEAEKHPHYHFGQGYYQWFYEKPMAEIRAQNLATKTKILSAVCSSKQMKHTAHNARFSLIQKVAQAIPSCDWYGHGVKPLAHKYEALDDYRYSLAIENHLARGHWSEKIADVLLAEALPFYAGDPTLADVLPRDSFIPIPLDNPDEAIRIIRTSIANNEYEKRLPAIREARKMLLEKYNLYAQILKVIREEENQKVTLSQKPLVLKSRHALRRHPLVALTDGWYHVRDEISRLFARL